MCSEHSLASSVAAWSLSGAGGDGSWEHGGGEKDWDRAGEQKKVTFVGWRGGRGGRLAGRCASEADEMEVRMGEIGVGYR